MSLGLVAYGSSDDSENSDGEEEIEPPKIADSIPQSNSSNHNAQKTVKENVSPQAEKEHLSEPHISDEEDFYGNEPVSGLHLPPPKHQENSNTHQDAAQSSAARGSTLLSGKECINIQWTSHRVYGINQHCRPRIHAEGEPNLQSDDSQQSAIINNLHLLCHLLY